MKYIVLDAPSGELPVMFPVELQHSSVAGCFSPIGVKSAGFVHIIGHRIECYGGSASLRIPSRRQRDSDLINRYLGGAEPER